MGPLYGFFWKIILRKIFFVVETKLLKNRAISTQQNARHFPVYLYVKSEGDVEARELSSG